MLVCKKNSKPEDLVVREDRSRADYDATVLYPNPTYGCCRKSVRFHPNSCEVLTGVLFANNHLSKRKSICCEFETLLAGREKAPFFRTSSWNSTLSSFVWQTKYDDWKPPANYIQVCSLSLLHEDMMDRRRQHFKCEDHQQEYESGYHGRI